MKTISSAENGIYRSFTRLKKKKYRDRENRYIIEGIHLIEEAVQNGAAIDRVFIREDFQEEAVIRLVEQCGAESFLLPRILFDRSADTETPQGIAAVAQKPYCAEGKFFENSKNFLVLDRLQDPGNIGTILRTADACGFRGAIIVKGTADLFAPKTVRAAAGSLHRIHLLFVESPEAVLTLLQHHGIRSICTSPRGGQWYYDTDLRENLALIIGNEAAGACDVFLQNADLRIMLPMEGSIESLNASIAASVLMYDSLRQRRMQSETGIL